MGWHLILHLDASDLLEFESTFKALPAPFVIDHMGRIKAADGLGQEPFRVLLEFMQVENCWVKVCGAERVSSMGPPFADALPFARALIEAAPERILWGTDWPHPNVGKHMPNDGDLVDIFPLMAPEAGLQHKILVENSARLYGFYRELRNRVTSRQFSLSPAPGRSRTPARCAASALSSSVVA